MQVESGILINMHAGVTVGETSFEKFSLKGTARESL